jgi:O-Antigen ligase
MALILNRGRHFTFFCMAALVSVYPPAALLLGLINVQRSWGKTEKYWLNKWLIILPSVFTVILVSRRFDEILPTLGFVLMSTFASVFLFAPRRIVISAYILTLISMFFFGIFQFVEADQTWQNGAGDRAPIDLVRNHVWLDGASPFWQKTWYMAMSFTHDRQAVGFEARVTSPETAATWKTTAGAVVLLHSRQFTRIRFDYAPDPFASHVVFAGGPVSGRTFRVGLEMRSSKHVSAAKCRGIWLQEVSGSLSSVCFATELTPHWKGYEFDWTAPITKDSPNSLQVVLNDFDGFQVDVRNLRFEEKISGRWESMLLPWIGITPVRDASNSNQRKLLNADGRWSSYLIVLPNQTQKVHALMHSAGRAVEIRALTSTQSLWDKLRSMFANDNRQDLWFGHPNLAGHTVMTLGLCSMLIGTRRRWYFLIFVVSTITVLVTGSRAALLGICLGGTWMLVRRTRGWHKLLIISLVALSFGLMIYAIPVVRSIGLNTLDDGNPVSRLTIWMSGVQVIFENPLGLGVDGFRQWFELRNPQALGQVNHAHNFWLEMGVRYGWLGICAGLYFSFALIFWAWRVGRWPPVIVVLVLLIVNFLDYTLFNPSILFTLYLTLNVCKTVTQQGGELS